MSPILIQDVLNPLEQWRVVCMSGEWGGADKGETECYKQTVKICNISLCRQTCGPIIICINRTTNQS